MKEEGARDESVINSDSEHARVLSAIVKIDTQKVQEWLHLVKIKTKNSDETRIWKENLQLILCQQDLINVYYHNSNESLEKSILRNVFEQYFVYLLAYFVWVKTIKSALMNNLTKNDLVDQLHLAMRLNQVDLALERINQAQKEILKSLKDQFYAFVHLCMIHTV